MLGATLVLAILPIILFQTLPAAGVEKHLLQLKQAGFPTTPHELQAWYTAVPDEENAARIIEEAIEEHVLHDAFEDIRLRNPGSKDPEYRGITKAYLETNAQ